MQNKDLKVFLLTDIEYFYSILYIIIPCLGQYILIVAFQSQTTCMVLIDFQIVLILTYQMTGGIFSQQ